MNRQIGLFIWLASVMLGCRSTSTPSVPTPPAYLLSLPASATTKCLDDLTSRGGGIVLFTYAERPPIDKSSSVGERGPQTGLVQSCEEIEVLNYEWSGFKQEFWVLIETQDGQKGWLAANFLVFDE